MLESLISKKKADGTTGDIINTVAALPALNSMYFPHKTGMSNDGKHVAFSYYGVSGVYPGFYEFAVGSDGKLAQVTTFAENRHAYNQGVGDNFAFGADGKRAALNVVSNSAEAGTVIIYQKDELSGIWLEEAKIKSPNHISSGEFGANYIFGPGNNSIYVAATGEDSTRGNIYEFRRNGSTWTHFATLPQATSGAKGGHGRSIAISEDESILVASNVPTNSFTIYKRFGGIWTLFQTVSRPPEWPTDTGPRFSDTVSISNDGKFIVANDPGRVIIPSTSVGAVALYSLNNDSYVLTDTIMGKTASGVNGLATGAVMAIDGAGRYLLYHALTAGNVSQLSRSEISVDGKFSSKWTKILPGFLSSRGISTARNADFWIATNTANKSVIYGR